MQKHLFLNEASLTLTDKTDTKNPTKRENYWIHTFKTKAPLGLMLKMVLRHKLSYFTSLIMSTEGLNLDNDSRT